MLFNPDRLPSYPAILAPPAHTGELLTAAEWNFGLMATADALQVAREQGNATAEEAATEIFARTRAERCFYELGYQAMHL